MSIPKEKIDELHKLLWWSKYHQLKILKTEGLHPTYEGIEITCNPATVNDHVQVIKSLISGMGYTIIADVESGKITIK